MGRSREFVENVDLHKAMEFKEVIVMKKFIFATGIISMILGVGLQFSAFSGILMPNEQPGMLLHIFGIVVIFFGIMLMFCTHDLNRRGNLVIWQGILRLGGFALMAWYGIFGNEGLQVAIGGSFDLIVGLAYIIGLPRYLNTSLINLMLDKK